MFITNNHVSFHLSWKESFDYQKVYQKVSKYYDHGCLQNFLLLSMSLLNAPIARKSHILVGIYFVFLKENPIPNMKIFWYRIWTSVKGSEKYLSSKTKFSKFKWTWNELTVKNCFQRQYWTKYLRQAPVNFRVK